MEKQLNNIKQAGKFDPIARTIAATALSQSLSISTERKYLENISCDPNAGIYLQANPYVSAQLSPYWIEIKTVGKPLDDNIENCFTAIQKILLSCFLPNKSQLLFMLHNEKGVAHLYLGVRPLNVGTSVDAMFMESLSKFMEGIWPGLKCECVIGKNMLSLNEKLNEEKHDRYRCIYSLTGIPSMESQYKSTYPSTIDKLIAGSRDSDFTYLVIANPVESARIDSILYQCRELNGQAESLKSFNFSENESTSNSVSNSISQKDFSTAKSKLLAVVGGAASVAGSILAMVNPTLGYAGLSLTGLGGLATSFIPQKSDSESYSESQGKTISANIVNKHIEAVAEHLFYHSKRFETGKAIGCWNVGVYLMNNKQKDIERSSLQLKAILSGQESIFEPIRIHNISNLIYDDNGNNRALAKYEAPNISISSSNGLLKHPFGSYFSELKTVLTTKELSYLINFPLRSVPGISVIDSSPEFSLNMQEKKEEKIIEIGKLLYGGSPTSMDYHIPISSLSRHTLLSGINGSGKTNTVQAILNGVKEVIPFLVIEPAKTEYVDWALEYNKNHPDNPIDIYIPGCKKYKTGFVPKQLKLNPFELVWLDKEQEPNVLTHIDRLKSTFAAAFPMYDILPVLMEDLIYTVYQNKSTDWLGEEPKFGVTLPPTLNSMSTSVDKVISNRQYEERIERNMKACLNTRIDSLKRGWKGEMLNTIHSTPWNELFEKPCVINLSYVGDDVDKSFFMALILQFLYEYRSALAEIGRIDFNDNGCKHLTVIEEAHRVMAKCDNQELPQYKSAMMFSNMFSEIRAYGEGMFLVDQVPTRLIPDAIKNTNLKITHRLVAEDDSKAIGESMGLSDEQRKVIAKLMTGQCVVSSSLSTDTYWVKVDKVK